MAEFREIVRAWADWQRETFPIPEHGRAEGLVRHLQKEVEELAANNADPLEMADVVALVICLADVQQVDLEDALRRKLAINKARTWKPDPETGAYRHTGEEDA